jgi:hypothetical protein
VPVTIRCLRPAPSGMSRVVGEHRPDPLLCRCSPTRDR